jgi:hypothetical protein
MLSLNYLSWRTFHSHRLLRHVCGRGFRIGRIVIWTFYCTGWRGRVARNVGFQVGVRVGRINGSIQYFIPDTRPEGMAADNLGNIFAGLTPGCEASPSGGCLQKWVRK